MILASSATAFGVVKWQGVAYLVWLGLSRLLGNDEYAAAPTTERKSLCGVFCQGVLIDVLNLKVALFFMAFLPQFVDPSQGGSAWVQILLLGLAFAVVGLCTDSLYALLSGTAGG